MRSRLIRYRAVRICHTTIQRYDTFLVLGPENPYHDTTSKAGEMLQL